MLSEKVICSQQTRQFIRQISPSSLDELADVIHARKHFATLASLQLIPVSKQANVS